MGQETLSIFDVNEFNILKIWERYPNVSSNLIRGCYAGFYNDIFSPDLNYYFSFPGLPVWYEELIKEFNSKFKNIKYEIIAEKEGFWSKSIYRTEYFERKALEDTSVVKVKIPLLTIKLSESYDKSIIKYLYYFFHHLIRVMGVFENYIPWDSYNLKPFKTPYLKFVLDKSNNGDGYRSLSEIKMNENILLKFDDYEFVNKRLSCYKSGHVTQTDIVFALVKELFSDIKVGSLVFAPVHYNFTKGRNEQALCKVTEISNRYVSLISVNSINNYSYRSTIEKLELYIPKPSNRISKFKIGDQIRTKKTKLRKEIKVHCGIVKEICQYNFIKIRKENGAEYFVDEDNFKLVPKIERIPPSEF